jgi:DNA mismatch repair ATPase MutS
MKALLMYPDRDFDATAAPARGHGDLVQDLALDTLLGVMGMGDAFITDIARAALLSGVEASADTIRYRQEIMADCLTHATVVRELYVVAIEALDRQRRGFYSGLFSRHPSSILAGAVESLEMFLEHLRRLRALADRHGGGFTSPGFVRLFDSIHRELDDSYLASVHNHLVRLKFRTGMLLSAALGDRNQGTEYVLREARVDERSWFQRIFAPRQKSYTVRVHERDEAGARALADLRDRGIDPVAKATSQAAEHVRSFFEMLRTELAFYVAALNLRDRLASLGAPIALPQPAPIGARVLQCWGLYDVALALILERAIVGNTIEADGAAVVIITGANQGGKSSCLRSIGLAQLMMQCGMFVGAEQYTADLCVGLFTHYTRQEDPTMTQGKLDEELGRMSDIADALTPNALVLFNESFAATNEHEGSEIARQVVGALHEKRVKICFVTHLHEFAHALFEQRLKDVLFLRAERLPDGTRTFRVVPGEPLETSYGEDLYREVFGTDPARRPIT